MHKEFTVSINEEEPRDVKNDLSFESENEKGFYYYIIENHNSFFRLNISANYKHKMITAAIKGNLEMFIENFVNTDKMKGFSHSEAIINGNWNILEYLINNYDIKENSLWFAIRYNNVEIVNKLMDGGHKLTENWLANCMRNDSIDVTKELILRRKAHLTFTKSEIRTSGFNQEIYKQKETSNFIRKHLDIKVVGIRF